MLFALIHLMAGTVLAGMFVIVVVATPTLFDMGMKAIPIAALAGFFLAAPVAYVVSKAIRGIQASTKQG